METKRRRKLSQENVRITAGHNMYFPAKDLYNKIERLRNQPDMQELKKGVRN